MDLLCKPQDHRPGRITPPCWFPNPNPPQNLLPMWSGISGKWCKRKGLTHPCCGPDLTSIAQLQRHGSCELPFCVGILCGCFLKGQCGNIIRYSGEVFILPGTKRAFKMTSKLFQNWTFTSRWEGCLNCVSSCKWCHRH